MTLGIYSQTNEDSIIDTNNQFTVTFDGRVGGAQDKQIYIRNNSYSRWYSNIQLSVVDLSGVSIVDGSQPGWSWKLAEKEIPLTIEEWGLIAAGNTLTLSSDIGSSSFSDIVTYLPVWVRIDIPRGQRIQTIVDVVFRLNAQESLIDG